jgi:hypothetical protein
MSLIYGAGIHSLAFHVVRSGGSFAAGERTPARQIEATDRAIDALVYELYGLTEDEIRVVEGRDG